MSEPQFTPGPLIVCKVYADNDALSHYELRRKETGELVVEVGDPDAMINKTYKVEMANVILYAAAPEMYRELENICLMCQRGEIEVEYTSRRLHGDCKNCQIGKVLKKARGEA